MRGHIEHRGQDRWRIAVDVGRDAKGRRKRISHPVHGSRKQAEAELARILHETNQGDYVEPGVMTVADYLAQWLTHAKTAVAPNTYRRYKQIVEGELIPAFGRTKLADLSPMQVQAFLARSLGRKRKVGGGDLSPRTVLHFYRVLRRSLNQAVRWQLLMRNPCLLVDPPRVEQKEMLALDDTQVKGLLGALKETRLHAPVVLALTTGMRQGEILALRWSDVDFVTGECRVVRSLQHTADGLAFKTPKTTKSRRVVLLPKITIASLKAHRIEQNKERLLAGAGYGDGDLMFARPDGSPWPPMQFSSDYRRATRRRGFRVRFHDLRHTHATHLLKESVPVNVVSERLGHANPSITLNVYSHVLPSMQQDAVTKIDAAWGEMMEAM